MSDQGTPGIIDKNGDAVRVSHSTLSTSVLCMRRAYFYKYYCMREADTMGSPTKIGSDAHLFAEAYLEGREPPTTSECVGHEGKKLPLDPTAEEVFLKGKHLNPDPLSVVVEEMVSVDIDTEYGPVQFVGKVDYFNLEHPEYGLYIGDHKTKGRLTGRYGALTEEQLAVELQPLRYAYTLCQHYQIAIPDEVTVEHIYYSRTAPIGDPDASAIVTSTTTKRKIEDVWNTTEQQTRAMAKAFAEANGKADNVAANTKACYAFGKLCPYAASCNATPYGKRPTAPKLSASKEKIQAALAANKKKREADGRK